MHQPAASRPLPWTATVPRRFQSPGMCRRARSLEHVSPGVRPRGASRGRWRGGDTMLKGHAFVLAAGAALIALDASASLAQDTTHARPHSTKRISVKKESGEVAPMPRVDTVTIFRTDTMSITRTDTVTQTNTVVRTDTLVQTITRPIPAVGNFLRRIRRRRHRSVRRARCPERDRRHGPVAVRLATRPQHPWRAPRRVVLAVSPGIRLRRQLCRRHAIAQLHERRHPRTEHLELQSRSESPDPGYRERVRSCGHVPAVPPGRWRVRHL